MNFSRTFLIILFFHLSHNPCFPAWQTSEKSKAFNDLGQYYEKGIKPPFEEAFNNLRSSIDSIRNFSAAYIYALCLQSQEDESNGRSEWSRTPYFYETWESKAHIFRQRLATYFGENANNIELIETAKWLILNDHEKDNKIEGFKAIKRIKCPETDEFLGFLISNPNLNEKITINAIEEVSDRRLFQFTPKIDALQNHYRAKIREAVYANASKLNLTRKKFDTQKACTPWVQKQLELINTLILDTIPQKASFVFVKCKIPFDNSAWEPEYTGWIIDENDTSYLLLDYSAQKININKRYCTLKSTSLKEESFKIQKTDLSDSRRWGGEIRQHAFYEIIPFYTLAAWCFNKNYKTEALTLLLEQINYTPDDSTFTNQIVDLFGNLYYNELLYTFSQERDYGKGLLISRHLSKPEFEGFRYKKEAVRLGEQLINRTEDFKSFKLPSVKSWDSLKLHLSKTEQIKYLTERLKLLNCVQNSQPGGISYSSTQYSVPVSFFSKSLPFYSNFPMRNIDDTLKRFLVINPYNELLNLKLTPLDIKIIVPYLADPDYILAYSFHRDFAPQRVLHKVSWVASDIILKSVGKKFLDLNAFESLDNNSKQMEIAKIISWCDENNNKTESELALNILENTKSWAEFEMSMNKCEDFKNSKSTPILIRRINDFQEHDWPSKSGQIARSIFYIGANTENEKQKIENLSDNKDLWVKLWASLFIIKCDKPKFSKGLSSLKVVLDSCDGTTWYPYAIETLINTKDNNALLLAEGILNKRSFKDQFDWNYYSEIIKRLFLAGSDQAFIFLKTGLNDIKPDPKYNRSNSNEILTCDRYIEILNKWKNIENPDHNLSISERKLIGKNLTGWLYKQYKLIKSGQISEIKPNEYSPPVYRIDAPGF